MPYASVSELPPAVRSKLKGKKLRQWMHVWNSAYARTKAESIAFAEAWATVKNADGFGSKTHVKKANTMTDFQIFMPIAKLDKAKRTVSGYASTPTKDSDGEIVTLDAVKAALPGYMEYGNIREMHALKAVGVADEANIDTTGLFLTARIVDDAAWTKCVEGVYKGFSIGGRKLSKIGNKITGIDLTEISIVDRPSNPDARFALAKSLKNVGDAGGYLLKLKAERSPEAKALAKMAKVVGDLAKAGPPAAHDGFSLPAPTTKTEPSPKDDSNQNNKAADGKVACKAHGVVGCEKCALDKTDEPPVATVELHPPAKKKKVKKMAKAKLAAALGLANDSFLTLRKRKRSLSGIAEEAAPVFEIGTESLHKSMQTAGSLSYAFDSIRSAQRSLMMEGKREGGDKKDQALAKQLGGIAKQLAGVIGQKAEHEGNEAIDMTDADDQYLSAFLGEDNMVDKAVNSTSGSGDAIADAVAQLMKRAATPTRAQRLAMAKADVDKSRKAAKAARNAVEDVHKMLKKAYVAKMAKASGKKPAEDDDGDFDHADAMGKLQKAFGDINKARDMAKAASVQIEKAAGRSGQRGQETTDGDSFYEVPAGVKDLSPAALAGASPGGPGGGSQPPMYPDAGQVYPGKAVGSGDLRKYAKNGVVSADVAELLMEKAQANGELEALRRLPSAGVGGRRPFAFDTTKIMGGTSGSGDVQEMSKALFDGVNVNDLTSSDERVYNDASAKVVGNLLMSGRFGKSVFDPSFRGMAGNGK